MEPKNLIRILSTAAFAAILIGCASVDLVPKYELKDGRYRLKQARTWHRDKVVVEVYDDSIHVADFSNQRVPIDKSIPHVFSKPTFDFDLLTVPFKYRPARINLPRQLNSNINANAMVGYRVDRFRLRPNGHHRALRIEHTGFGLGVFGGFGSTFVSPWTTNNGITDEYDGLVLTRGVTALAAIGTLTVGLCVGWDHLTDRNRSIWIYEDRPWMGITVGINLN